MLINQRQKYKKNLYEFKLYSLTISLSTIDLFLDLKSLFENYYSINIYIAFNKARLEYKKDMNYDKVLFGVVVTLIFVLFHINYRFKCCIFLDIQKI